MSAEEDGSDRAAGGSSDEFYHPASPISLADDTSRLRTAIRNLLTEHDVAWRRRVLFSAIGVLALVIVYAYTYQWMLLTFEGVEVSITDSLQVVVEAFTTAGFGGDTGHWNTHPMNLWVIAMNLTGVLLVFIALPLFVFPLLRASLVDEPPESTELTEHVILCSAGDPHERLREELAADEHTLLVVDRDPDSALEIVESGGDAMVGDPIREPTLRAANVDAARALVADVDDEDNLAVTLTARDISDSIPIITIAEAPAVAAYHRDAGADRVIRPSHVLGRSFARKADPAEYVALLEAFGDGPGATLTELLVTPRSDLVGGTLASLELRSRFDRPVLGVWAKGGFLAPPDPDLPIAPFMILVFAGQPPPEPATRTRSVTPATLETDRFVVAGQDVVGAESATSLTARGRNVTVIDDGTHAAGDEGEGEGEGDDVDVLGDPTDPDRLQTADPAGARSTILSLEGDTATMFAGVALRRIAPDVELLARADSDESVSQIYRAGADYVLTRDAVTSRMVSRLLGTESLETGPPRQADGATVATCRIPNFDGLTPRGINLRVRTGALLVALHRDGELITELPPGFTLRGEDRAVVIGDEDAIEAFRERAQGDD